MVLKERSDEELIHALNQRDLLALEELYSRFNRLAMAVAYRVLSDQKLAEDVLQEAFLSIWRGASSYSPDRGSVKTWVLSIVRHRAIDMVRRLSRSRNQISLDEIHQEPRYPDPWEEASANIDKEQILEAVETLPPVQRDVIMQAFFGGLTHREIAENTGIPLGTIKGRMRLGMKKLRTLLEDYRTGEAD